MLANLEALQKTMDGSSTTDKVGHWNEQNSTPPTK
ncbi:hypothetical protein swp_1712 [Shewanella piezotolerans WP3]|uniref:Uncharacterized protein n=1 Tax=Shewanella piezotolerans (strain WP3 / JCM 13877) TaxID=225849 RepID=B8CMY3_SHEPW|nr:hypothetical protein swp_1712 [Shewanella piezotolerans WP3]